MKTEHETVTVTQAAKLLNVSERTVRRLVKARKLHLLRPVPKHKKRRQYILVDKAFEEKYVKTWHFPSKKNGTVNLDDEKNKPVTSFRGGCTAAIWLPTLQTEWHFNAADTSPIQTVTETSQLQVYLRRTMTRLADKVDQAANASLQAQSSADKASLSVLDASQKEEICTLHVKHAAEWCAKAQKAYIACAEERRGSLRCAAWCTFACIIAALILIANLFA